MKRITKNTSFPRSGINAAGDLLDFTSWVDGFVRQSPGQEIALNNNTTQRESYFKCYHPSNYQSRSFVADNYNPHGPKTIQELVPDVDIVDKTYWFMDYVAITEFFHESKCLLYHRLTPKTPEIQLYLDNACHCNPVEQNVTLTDEEQLHHDGRRRKTMLDLPPALLQSIAALSTTDTHLFQAALPQFLREISWLEASLGRRVMCDKVLQKWEPELEYLGFNVTDLYFNIKMSR